MTLDQCLELTQEGIKVSMLVSAPVLLFGLAAGTLVSIIQAATQINDAALAFIPKMAAATLALVIFGPWMISTMTHYAVLVFNQIPAVAQ